jgi:hypothetical protein
MASSGVAMVISDISTLYVDTTVDETDIGKIQVGQPVQITLNALPNVNLTGTVMRITQTADTTASVITYAVRIALDKADAPIKVGMSANAIFIVSQARNVLRVPNNYLRVNNTTGQTTVLLVNTDGTLVPVPVTTGLQGSDYTEIVNGLNAGETIALVTGTSVGNTAAGGNGGNFTGGNANAGGNANGGGSASAGGSANGGGNATGGGNAANGARQANAGNGGNGGGANGGGNPSAGANGNSNGNAAGVNQ